MFSSLEFNAKHYDLYRTELVQIWTLEKKLFEK